MNKKIIFALFCMTLDLSAATQEQTTTDHTITVFVHGTYPVGKLLRISPGRPLIYCPKGLSLAKDLPKCYQFHKMVQGCVDLNNQLYSFDQFYVFGWKSEKVYDSVRKQAAQDLVTDLQKLVKEYYKKHGIQPSVRLIGFSHGGNVLLHTAQFLPLMINQNKLNVEVWLFGTPVQQINCDFINSKNFTKVYSIYSQTDWIQRMDPQGLYTKKIRKTHFWSDRMFDTDSQCIQVNFTVNGKSIGHVQYISIFKYFASIQELIEQQVTKYDSKLISIDLPKKKLKQQAKKLKKSRRHKNMSTL